jgi:hypothetical protein
MQTFIAPAMNPIESDWHYSAVVKIRFRTG